MRRILKDPLLSFAKVGTILVRIGLVVGLVGLGAAAATSVISPSLALEELVEANQLATRNVILAAVIAAIVTGMVVLALMYDFVTRLAAIIDTVGAGEPFIQDNAARLNRMGWLALAVQALTLPATMLSTWLEPQFANRAVQFNAEFSFTGLVLAVVLFILARVFRHGAAMREDLEGTV